MNLHRLKSLSPSVIHIWIFPLAILCLAVQITLSPLNQKLFLFIQKLTQTLPDAVWSNISALGDTAAALAICLVLLSGRQQRFAILPAAILGILFTHIPKQLLPILRPAATLPHDKIHIIGAKLIHNSFPSGHTLTAFMLVSLVVMLCHYRYRHGWWLAAIAIGIARIAVGAHWPGDVLAGAALGWVSAYSGVIMVNHWHWLKQPTIGRIVDLFASFGVIYLIFELPHHYPYTHFSGLFLGTGILLWVFLKMGHTNDPHKNRHIDHIN